MATPQKNPAASAAPAKPATSAPATVAEGPKRERVTKLTTKLFKSIETGKENGVKIAGFVSDVKLKPSANDPSEMFSMFQGDFRAKVGQKIYASQNLVVPRLPEKMLTDKFREVSKLGENDVTFSMTVFREAVEKTVNPRGYIWAVDNFSVSAITLENDPLVSLVK